MDEDDDYVELDNNLQEVCYRGILQLIIPALKLIYTKHNVRFQWPIEHSSKLDYTTCCIVLNGKGQPKKVFQILAADIILYFDHNNLIITTYDDEILNIAVFGRQEYDIGNPAVHLEASKFISDYLNQQLGLSS